MARGASAAIAAVRVRATAASRRGAETAEQVIKDPERQSKQTSAERRYPWTYNVDTFRRSRGNASSNTESGCFAARANAGNLLGNCPAEARFTHHPESKTATNTKIRQPQDN
jgi:hypothetical protein